MARPVKMILMGDQGSGKTASIVPLATAGYKVRFIDLDNGVDVLSDLLTNKMSPLPAEARLKAIENIRFRTLTEPMRVVAGQIQPKAATVWPNAVGLFEDFKGVERIFPDGRIGPAEGEKFGPIQKWGVDTVLVIDTLSTIGTAALNFYLMMNGALGKTRTSNEGRRDIGAAQSMLDKLFQFVFDTSVGCNVILNTHIVWALEDGSPFPDNYKPDEHGPKCMFPAAIGKALSPRMGKYFNNLLFIRREGMGQRIYTRGISNAGLKSQAPLRVAQSYDQRDGLAKYFEAVLGADGAGAQGALAKKEEVKL